MESTTPPPYPVWRLLHHELHFRPKHPLVMGIVNVTPDSFSDGGQFLAAEAAIAHGKALAAEGAHILDVGGESTRPGARPVSAEEECDRVVPVIEGLVRHVDLPVSIDTSKALVAEAALAAGASIVNDVSCLRFDPALADVASGHDVPLILMHSRHTPADMQRAPHYDDLWPELIAELQRGIDLALAAGVRPHQIAVDPGIGFGKRQADNLQILQDLSALHALGYPILLGASRKSFLGKILDLEVDDRLEGSLAAAAAAAYNDAHMVRVHDVKETRRLLDVIAAIRNA